MIKRIYINKQVIASNIKNEENEPPISVKTYSSTYHCYEVLLKGESKIIYSPDKPLSSGPRVWIETEDKVKLDNGIFI